MGITGEVWKFSGRKGRVPISRKQWRKTRVINAKFS